MIAGHGKYLYEKEKIIKKKKICALITLLVVVSLLMTACGQSGTTQTADSSKKQDAVGILMSNDKVVADVIVDISAGYSVAIDWNGITLFEGEYSDDKMGIASVVSPEGGEIYERIVEEAKGYEDFKEEDGVMTYTNSLGELNILYEMEGIPFLFYFEKGVDEAKAQELKDLFEINLRKQ